MSKSEKRSKRHTPEQIVAKLRDADAMLNAGKDIAAVLQSLGVSEATLHRWRAQYGGMKSEEAKRLVGRSPSGCQDHHDPVALQPCTRR